MSGRPTITVGGASRDGLTSLGTMATLRRLSAHHRFIRMLVVVGPMLSLAATMGARGAFQPIALLVIGVLAIGCAISPDSHVGLLVVLLVSLNWLQTVDDQTTPWVLLAAMGLLLLHAGMAAATVAPPAATWTRSMTQRWMTRTGLVGAVTAVAWASTVAIGRADPAGSAIALVSALCLAAGLTWWTRSRSVTR